METKARRRCLCVTMQGYSEEVTHLKKKVDAGSAFVITQMFLDANAHADLVKPCHIS